MSRFLLSISLAVVSALLPIGQTQGQVIPPGASHRVDYEVAFQGHDAEISAATAEVTAALPYLTLEPNGQISYRPPKGLAVPSVAASVARVNEGLNRLRGASVNAWRSGVSTAQAYWCTYLPIWALDAFAWLIIIEGGVGATAGLFLDATILGIPAGVVLSALGIWYGITGSALLWYFDNYYPNGAIVCY